MISVVIPARDAANTIKDCLEAVLSQKKIDFDYEVIVVDDGSRDNTAEIAESLGVKVIRQLNAGPGAARNSGVNAAQGEIIAFTDADCVPTSEWLCHIIQPFIEADVVGVKGTYLCNQEGRIA